MASSPSAVAHALSLYGALGMVALAVPMIWLRDRRGRFVAILRATFFVSLAVTAGAEAAASWIDGVARSPGAETLRVHRADEPFLFYTAIALLVLAVFGALAFGVRELLRDRADPR